MEQKKPKLSIELFNKLKTKTGTCKICFEEIEESIHTFLHKDACICSSCFKRFNPVLKTFKVEGIKCEYLFNYDQTVQELLYQFKGCADIELSHVFLEYFREYFRIKYHGYTLIPAPSAKEGDKARGFNHVVEMFSILKMQMIRCIHKIKNIKQADLSAAERSNVHKILQIDDVNLTNEKILIVDDVYTTGSTVKSMIELVKSKNPKKIKVLVMSKTFDLDDQNRTNS